MSPKQKDPVTETMFSTQSLEKKGWVCYLQVAKWALDANGHCPLWLKCHIGDTIGVT